MRQSHIKKMIFYPLALFVTALSVLLFYFSPPKLNGFFYVGGFSFSVLMSPPSAISAFKKIYLKENIAVLPQMPQFIFHNFLNEDLPKNKIPTEIPTDMGEIEETALPTGGEGDRFIPLESGYIRNLTEMPRGEIITEIANPLPFNLEINSAEPQILIMHTHATESYETVANGWFDPSYNARNTDITQNMVAVGTVLCDELNANGINTLHDETLFDYPSYTAAYGNSRAAVIDTLAKYPSIKVVLDVHRDAIERDGKRIKPTCNVNGVAAAQLMIICGADDGTMNMPNYRKNLCFAAALQTAISAPNEGLCRPVLFDYRNYNQGLTTGSLLLEFGGHANTLDEAKYTAKLVAKAMVTLFTQK